MNIVHILYMLASILFIIGIKRLSSVKTARSANAMSAVAMFIAIIASLIEIDKGSGVNWGWVLGGLAVGTIVGGFLAIKVKMEGMPELVGYFNGMGGLASALVALSMSANLWFFVARVAKDRGLLGADTTTTGLPGFGPDQAITLMLSIVIGGITFTGSLIAWAKLKGAMSGGQIFLPAHHGINLLLIAAIFGCGIAAFFVIPADQTNTLNLLMAVSIIASLVLGVTFAIPVGGADMPVVISLLNSFSGIAAAMTGFVLQNNLLIISGSLVGAAGMILTIIMCRGMNRSLSNVLFAKFSQSGGGGGEYKNVKTGDPVDVAIALANASNVIIIPGYGMAAAQAQHAVRELADYLEDKGANVRFAIHEVAGRMPGHMNVLLAEANVPYEKLFKREDIEADFKTSDVALVIGANDVVNPAAQRDETSPLYGMPILPAHEAQQAFVVKRSMASGFAGIKNELFEADNTLMVLGSAKEVINNVIEELKQQ